MLSQTPQVWLDHQLYRLEDGVLLAWDSVADLFPQGVPQAMFSAYVELVQRLADSDWNQPQPVLLPLAQQARRDQQNSLPALAPGRGLLEDFFRQSARQPDALALICGAQRWTYNDLATQALRIAAGLLEAGMRQGEAVEVCLPRGPRQIAAVFGVLQNLRSCEMLRDSRDTFAHVEQGDRGFVARCFNAENAHGRVDVTEN